MARNDEHRDLEALACRIEEVARQNARLIVETNRLKRSDRTAKGLAVVALGILGVLVSAGGSKSGAVLEAEQFVMKDAEGHERAKLALGDDGSPRLLFRDAQGRIRIQISVGPTGTPGFRLFDETGKAEIGASVSPGSASGRWC